MLMDYSKLQQKDSSSKNMSIISLSAQEITTSKPMLIENDLWLIVKSGHIHITSELFSIDVNASSFCVLVAGTSIENTNVSDDFKALLFVISGRFKEDLGISELLALRRKFNTCPTIPLNEESIAAIDDYERMAKRIINLENNPYKWESLLNLTRAFYYGGGFYFFKNDNSIEPEDSVLSKFFSLVEKNASKNHRIGFYADALCLTPKYLSQLIKRKTGKTAKEIISGHILLKAKSMLTNSRYNIQEISEMLNFPSQSVFGKFFKQSMGMSPRAYRKEYTSDRN